MSQTEKEAQPHPKINRRCRTRQTEVSRRVVYFTSDVRFVDGRAEFAVRRPWRAEAPVADGFVGSAELPVINDDALYVRLILSLAGVLL